MSPLKQSRSVTTHLASAAPASPSQSSESFPAPLAWPADVIMFYMITVETWIVNTSCALRTRAGRIVSDRTTQVTAASAACGATCLGASGAAVGTAVGVTVGGVFGLVPALFTFGVSVPFGAAIGGGCGFAAGSALGLGSGGIVGGLAGYNIFCRRASISALAQKVWSPVQSVIDLGVDAFHREAKRATGKIASIKERLVSSLAVARDDSMKVLRDKRVQVVSASAACGAATVGAAGAASGFAAGGLFGALAGVIPAFFTFGLSIPVCAAVGSSCGFVAGSTAGASTGLVAGGAAGLGVYGKRHAIEAVARSTWTKLETFLARARAASLAHATAAKNTANSRYEVVKSKAFEAAGATKTKTLEVISDRGVQVTTGSAACGAAAGSVGGAATGFLTGASLGAAVGVVPAVFTFGLSVPVGAAIGAGCGLTAGATVGGTAGGVAGGVAGRSMYFNRQRLRNGAAQTWSKASDCAEFVKIKASKLVGGTGGTD